MSGKVLTIEYSLYKYSVKYKKKFKKKHSIYCYILLLTNEIDISVSHYIRVYILLCRIVTQLTGGQ